jgi:tetratricopeptide (TPR) repeat protein
MSGTLTVGERIVLHLAQFSKYIDSYDAPLDISQDGIAAALRISRAHAAIELKKLKDSGEVVEKLVHIRKGKTKRKVYFLNPPGEERARRIRQFAESEGIDIQPFLDLKKCKGPELWSSLDDDLRTLLAQACVFRKPFLREALPESTVSLLPVDADGLVDMPLELRTYVPTMVAPEMLRQFHSFAADHWLGSGEYRERLYHLLAAGRVKEAEMLLASKGYAALGPADKDLYDLVMAVPGASPRYRGRILLAQASVARSVGDRPQSLKKASELQSSPDPRDRYDGLLVEALVLRDQGDHAAALSKLGAAREIRGPDDEASVECEVAETMMRAGRLKEAKEVLERLLGNGAGDGDALERIFFQLGTLSLRSGNGAEAVRFFSKCRGAARDKENCEVYERLSDAYGLMGMKEKAEEYAVRAKRVRGVRS